MKFQDGGSKMADPRWRIQDGGSKMADPRWRIQDGGSKMAANPRVGVTSRFFFENELTSQRKGTEMRFIDKEK